MTEVSPKKVPIDDWVKAVRSLDVNSLKDDEKKVFELVKQAKNIPKSQTKFANFCIHNLKIKDEKVVNKIWGQLSQVKGAVIGKSPSKDKPEKQTQDAKKAKLAEKHGKKTEDGSVVVAPKNNKQNTPAKTDNKKQTNGELNTKPGSVAVVPKNNKQNPPAKTDNKKQTNGEQDTKPAKAKFTNFCVQELKIKDQKVINKIWGQLSQAKGAVVGKQPEKPTQDTKKVKQGNKTEDGSVVTPQKNNKQNTPAKTDNKKQAAGGKAQKNNKQVANKAVKLPTKNKKQGKNDDSDDEDLEFDSDEDLSFDMDDDDDLSGSDVESGDDSDLDIDDEDMEDEELDDEDDEEDE